MGCSALHKPDSSQDHVTRHVPSHVTPHVTQPSTTWTETPRDASRDPAKHHEGAPRRTPAADHDREQHHGTARPTAQRMGMTHQSRGPASLTRAGRTDSSRPRLSHSHRIYHSFTMNDTTTESSDSKQFWDRSQQRPKKV
jgi:hypothetical protein